MPFDRENTPFSYGTSLSTYLLDDFERPKLTVPAFAKNRIEMAKLSFIF